MKNSIFTKIRFLFEFYIFYFLYVVLSLLPINIVSTLGGLIFRSIGPLTKKHKIVTKNLLQIFPQINKKEISSISKKSWFNTGKTFFELLVLPKLVKGRENIKIENKEYVNDILNKKEKVIFIGIHQSNWEILVASIDKLGISVGAIYRHINNPFIDKFILNIRKKSISSKKSFYTPKGKQSAKEIIEGIKKNISMILLIDQKDSAGKVVNFFNYPSKTQIGFIKIAQKYKMKIVPVQNIRHANANFTLRFHQPIEIDVNKLSDIEFMDKIHKIIEKWIKSDPANWFLQHNRFN